MRRGIVVPAKASGGCQPPDSCSGAANPSTHPGSTRNSPQYLFVLARNCTTIQRALFAAFLLFNSQSLSAQQTIQQPVVGVTSVNTTVSVPDRGSMFLGGVSSAQSGRSQYGPLRTGPSTGLSRQATSISVNVYIHDLQAMDEELLNSAPPPAEARRVSAGAASNKPAREPTPEVVVSPAEKALKFELLARKADESGKTGVAKLHWQMAAKYGSKAAEERLAEIARPSVTSSPRTANR